MDMNKILTRISELAWTAAEGSVDPHFILGKISELAEEGLNVLDKAMEVVDKIGKQK